MKKDLVTSLESFGTVCVHYIASLVKDNGNYVLTLHIVANGTKSYLSYNNFAVGPANSQYQLSLSGFTGLTSYDPMGAHPLNGMKFSTKDRDNDHSSHCAVKHHGSNAGGWWYNNCAEFHSNHQYNSSYSMYLLPPVKWYALPFIEIKIKESDCSV